MEIINLENSFSKSRLPIKLGILAIIISIIGLILPFGFKFERTVSGSSIYTTFGFISGYNYGIVTIFLLISLLIILFSLFFYQKSNNKEKMEKAIKIFSLGIISALTAVILATILNFFNSDDAGLIYIGDSFLNFIPFHEYFSYPGIILTLFAQFIHFIIIGIIIRHNRQSGIVKEGFFYDRPLERYGMNKFGFMSLGLKIATLVLILSTFIIPIVTIIYKGADISLTMTGLGTQFDIGPFYEESFRDQAEQRFQSITGFLLIFVLLTVILLFSSIIFLYYDKRNFSALFSLFSLIPFLIYFFNFFVLQSVDGSTTSSGTITVQILIEYGLGYYLLILGIITIILSFFFNFNKVDHKQGKNIL